MSGTQLAAATAAELIATQPGRLIGVSLGPGDPDLITRRAFARLTSSARWAYPVTGPGARSHALEIACRAGLAVPADALALHFPMTRDRVALTAAWQQAAAHCLTALAGGRDLAFLVEGDASTYSTFGHLAATLRDLAPGLAIEVIPGVTSFAAAAARLAEPLVSDAGVLAVIPAAYGIEVIDRLLDQCDTLVLLKVNPLLDQVLALLERRGLSGHARYLERLGTAAERVLPGLDGLHGSRVPYLSLLLVKNPGRHATPPAPMASSPLPDPPTGSPR